MCHHEVSYNKPHDSYSALNINWWGIGKSVVLHCETNIIGCERKQQWTCDTHKMVYQE